MLSFEKISVMISWHPAQILLGFAWTQSSDRTGGRRRRFCARSYRIFLQFLFQLRYTSSLTKLLIRSEQVKQKLDKFVVLSLQESYFITRRNRPMSAKGSRTLPHVQHQDSRNRPVSADVIYIPHTYQHVRWIFSNQYSKRDLMESVSWYMNPSS